MVSFEIDFKDFQLGDVLQFLVRVKKSGVLRITGDISGEIYLKDGLVVHATDSANTGMEALLNLSFVDLDRGSFEPAVNAPEQTITGDFGKLSEDIEKRRIEFEEIKEKFPPMSAVLAKSTKELESAVALRRSDWQILALIDGKRKLGDVIAESKIGGYEATKTITWLKERGMIYEPMEAERAMAVLTHFLRILFKDFGKNGLNWLKKWAAVNPRNKKVVDTVYINEATFEIKPMSTLSTSEITESLRLLGEYIRTEGPNVYGKVLFKKKWQDFKQKVSVNTPQ